MTPTEAWRIISANLMELYKLKKTDTFKGYTDADIEAELICFKAVNRMQKEARGNDRTRLDDDLLWVTDVDTYNLVKEFTEGDSE